MTIIRKFETEEIKNTSWRSKKISMFAGLMLTFLVVLEIWASNTLVSFGEKYAKISKLEISLEQENKILENYIAKEASLSNIASSAATLGLNKPRSIKYLP